MRAALADPPRAPKNPGFSRYAVSVSNRGTPHGPALTFTRPSPPSISQRRNKRRCVLDVQRETSLLSSLLYVLRDDVTRSTPDRFPPSFGHPRAGWQSRKARAA